MTLKISLKHLKWPAVMLLPLRFVGPFLTARCGPRDAGLNPERAITVPAGHSGFFRASLKKLPGGLALLSSILLISFAHSGFARNWSLTGASTNDDWKSIACSADGGKFVAVAYDDGLGNGGPIDVSTNSGATWKQTSAPTTVSWQSVASSANGSNLVAAVNQDLSANPGQLYVSTNAGKTWKATPPTNFWAAVASSADGSKLVAVDSGSGDSLIYFSTNFGITWSSNSVTSDSWAAVTISADGSKMAAADSGYGDGMI